jgi:hypothetical protein
MVIPVKMGIQDLEEENWIPACAGMTDKRTTMSKVDLKSTCNLKPLAFKARVVYV